MQMNNMTATGPFVQVVNVLGHNCYLEIFLQFGQQFMPAIRFHFQQLLAAFIIEMGHQFGVACITFGSGYLFYRITIPQSSCITKGTDATLSAHSGA